MLEVSSPGRQFAWLDASGREGNAFSRDSGVEPVRT
jgi:hypothetical protein